MATYTRATSIDHGQLAMCYALDDLRIKPLHGGAANSSFTVTAVQGRFVLTVLDNHDQASAATLAANTEALYQLGVPTTPVVRTVEGASTYQLNGRPIMLKQWIEGSVFDLLPDTLLTTAGQTLARLHQIPADRVPAVSVGTRRLHSDRVALIRDFADREFASWLTARLNAVGDKETELSTGEHVVCHGDLFSDNLVVRPDGELAVIDWETLSLDSAVFDLGMAVAGLAMVQGRLDHDRAHRIIAGYTTIRPLTAQELAVVAREIEYAAVVIAFERYYRHIIRFPDPSKAHIYRELIGFVDSIAGFLHCARLT